MIDSKFNVTWFKTHTHTHTLISRAKYGFQKSTS